jgi:hypothetical protein
MDRYKEKGQMSIGENRWTCEQRKGLTVRVQNKGELDIEKIRWKSRSTNEHKKIQMWLKKDIWSIPNAIRKSVENTFLIH